MTVKDDFSPKGILATAIEGFKPRKPQQVMAKAVTTAIKKQQELVVEAGTGTGKTFAYLVPSLRSEKKVIISTGSKALQDQLFTKDLPIIKDALNYTGRVALLKGRSNYLCLERMAQHYSTPGELNKSLLADLTLVRHWASKTVDGDISLCSAVTEDSLVWPLVTSTNDNCLGSDCPHFNDCFVAKARKRAMAADVVIVNHHLFLADAVVKETGFAELIPQAEVMIFDEAHQLPDIASQYFGQQLSSRQLIELAKDIILIYRTEVRDIAQLQKCADRLSQAAQDLRIALGEPGFRGNLREVLGQGNISQHLRYLFEALDFCYDVIKLALGRSSGLDSCFDRVSQYKSLLMRLTDTDVTGFSYWFECSNYHFLFALTPLSVASKFRELLDNKKGCWIFTSATLSVNENLAYFTQRLGLEKAETLLLSSPFDYARQALLCVPRYLPSPNQYGGAKQLVTILQPIIEANGGRCFFLCTSHQMMRDLTEQFRQTMTIPVLMQGETSKNKLLAQFIEQGNALLVATSSFWEGVDVRGDTLSCVIIDKLPFSSPDDPLLKARMEDCRLQGGDPFSDVQLPEAVIALKQGVGRLIRDNNDRGVIIVCDNRLVMRPYGEVFLNSLPPAPRTRDLTKVINFLLNLQR